MESSNIIKQEKKQLQKDRLVRCICGYKIIKLSNYYVHRKSRTHWKNMCVKIKGGLILPKTAKEEFTFVDNKEIKNIIKE